MDDFVAVCSDYVFACERDVKRSIDSMYGFLSGRLDSVGKAQRLELITQKQEELDAMLSVDEFMETDVSNVSAWKIPIELVKTINIIIMTS